MPIFKREANGGEAGGAVRGGCGLDLAVPNLGEWRRLVRSRAGESHAVVFDGPIPPKCAGACGPAALGGGRLQEFRHLLELWCSPCGSSKKALQAHLDGVLVARTARAS